MIWSWLQSILSPFLGKFSYCNLVMVDCVNYHMRVSFSSYQHSLEFLVSLANIRLVSGSHGEQDWGSGLSCDSRR